MPPDVGHGPLGWNLDSESIPAPGTTVHSSLHQRQIVPSCRRVEGDGDEGADPEL